MPRGGGVQGGRGHRRAELGHDPIPDPVPNPNPNPNPDPDPDPNVGEQKSGTTLLATLLKSGAVLGQDGLGQELDGPTLMHGQGVRRLEDARTTGLVAQPPGLTARPRRITWHAPPPLGPGRGRRLAEARPSAAALGDQDPLKKELHLFNRAAENCVLQPSACVESLCSRQEVASRPGGWLVDATPSYFSSAAALMQLAAALPRAKLLLLLREPVGRAMSAWKQNLKAGSEPRSFDVAVLDELEAMASRCFPAEAKLLAPIRRPITRTLTRTLTLTLTGTLTRTRTRTQTRTRTRTRTRSRIRTRTLTLPQPVS
jgi:hypothetical protein